MDLNFDFKVGQVVKSLKGRDKGEVMIIVEVISLNPLSFNDSNLRKLLKSYIQDNVE